MDEYLSPNSIEILEGLRFSTRIKAEILIDGPLVYMFGIFYWDLHNFWVLMKCDGFILFYFHFPEFLWIDGSDIKGIDGWMDGWMGRWMDEGMKIDGW